MTEKHCRNFHNFVLARVLYALFLLFLFSPFYAYCFGQSTVVSATIQDASGQAWKQGTYTFFFRTSPLNPTSVYYLNGVPLTAAQQTILGHMDTTGSFSGVSVPSNTSITPSGSTWDVQVCPISQGNTTCFTQRSITITGATQSLSSVVVPPAALIDLAHPEYPFVMAYTNGEFSTAPMGGIYYDYTQAHYFLCTNVTPSGQAQWYGTCLTWKEFCLVGDGLCAAGSTTTWFLNNVLVGVEPNYDVIPGTNISISATDDPSHTRVHYTINATAGSGCTLPGVNTGVLSEHPAGTCYDSLHFTWDDTNENLQASDGTTTFTGTNVNTFSFGAHNALTDVTDSNIEGNHNSITCDANTIGSTNCDLFSIAGAQNGITDTGVSSSSFNDFLFSRGSTISATGGSSVSYVMSLLGANTFTAGTAGSLNADFSAGRNNQVTSTAASSGSSSIYQLGENHIASSASGSQNINVIQLGENNTSAALLSSTTEFTTQLGYNHNFTSQAGLVQSYGFAVGHGNSGQSSSAAMTEFGLIGHNLTLSNCSHCYLFGETANLSNTNFIGVGLSATPELEITPGVLDVTPWPVTQMQTISICASGCTITATPCTISSGASYDVCTNSITWPNAFVDSNYTVICNGEVNSTHASPGNGSTNYALTAFAQKGSLTTTTFTLVTQNQRTNTAAFDEVDCTGTHR